jgi:hypothetical protein
MIRPLRAISRVTVLAVALAGLAVAASPAFALVVFAGTGPTAASITPTRDAFRIALGGGTLAGANGLFSDGTGARREINWDGVPDGFAAPNNLPANFFNVNSPRGAVFSTPGTGFQVSANAGVAPVEFGNLDASYPSTFAPFSPQRLFTALGSNVVDVNFFVPGTTTAALVHGFGAVFSDVDLDNTSSIQFFDQANTTLGTFFVPATVGSETFSFLGVSFPTNVVSRVRITSGNIGPGPGVTDQNGNTRDVVVMDDFIYGEPSVPTAVTFASFSGRRTRQGVVLRWRTAQEVGSLGFNVYRGPIGHRRRLNHKIVRATGSVGGARYTYRDAGAARHRRLSYWLQEIGTDGSRRWRGPLVVSTA